MAVTKVLLQEVLQDIRSGMDEAAIRRKYNLSTQGVKHLYERLIEAKLLEPDVRPVPRRINIANILADIRAGMSSSDLMKKYSMSEGMLKQVSKKILDARGNRSADDDPETLIQEMPEFLATREFLRHEVDFRLPIYEASLPETHGTVRDVSDEGLSVLGIEANVGEVKTLVVLGDELGQFSSFEFEGFCRWRFADPDDGTCLTGFAINKISEDDYRQLRKLVHVVTMGG
jgi:Mor family transcriptional regulator